MTTFEQVQSVLSTMLGVTPAQITQETKRADFASWDSLKHLDITMELEAVCRVSFSLDEMTSLNSVQRIVDVINTKRTGGIQGAS